MWELPKYFKNNFSDVSLGFLKFVFSQSEKKLNELVKAGEDITKKAHTILGISVTIFTLSLGGLFGFELKDPFIQVFLISISSIAFVSIALLIKPLLSYGAHLLGSDPSDLFKEELIANFTTDLSKEKNLYMNESVNYQGRINYNRKMNLERTKYVDLSMYLLVGSPFIGGLLSLFVSRCL